MPDTQKRESKAAFILHHMLLSHYTTELQAQGADGDMTLIYEFQMHQIRLLLQETSRDDPAWFDVANAFVEALWRLKVSLELRYVTQYEVQYKIA